MRVWIRRLGVLGLLSLVGSAQTSVEALQGFAFGEQSVLPPDEPLSLWYRRPAVQSGPRPCRSATAGWAAWSSAASTANGSSSTKARSGPAAPTIPSNAESAELLPEARRLIFAGQSRRGQPDLSAGG